MRTAIPLPVATRRFAITFPVLLALLALLVFVVNAMPRPAPFWVDEAYTVLQVRAHSWAELLQINLQNEETPPLYFGLLRLWSQLWGGSGEVTLRLFSALCLALTVPLLAVLGRRLFNEKVGVVAALLLAVNPIAHYYGQETRVYALALLLAVALLLTGRRFLDEPSVRRLLAYVVVGTLLLYTSYFGAFTLAGLGLFGGGLLFLRWWQERPLRRPLALGGWIAAQLAMVLLWLPWLSGLRYQLVVSGAARAPEQRNIVVQALVTLLALGANTPDQGLLSLVLVVVLFLALVTAAIHLIWSASRPQWLWWAAVLVLPLAAGLLVLHGDGQFSVRYVLLTLPAYVLLLAAGLLVPSRLARLSRALLGALVVLSACYCLVVAPTPQRRGGWDQVARVVSQGARPDDVLVFAPPWSRPAFIVQYEGPALRQYGAASFADYYYEGHHAFSEELDAAALRGELARGHRVWLTWDRIYAHRPATPPHTTVHEYAFGTAAVLLLTPDASRP